LNAANKPVTPKGHHGWDRSGGAHAPRFSSTHSTTASSWGSRGPPLRSESAASTTRGLGLPIIGAAWARVLLALVIAGLGQMSVVAIVVLDVAIQAHAITVQSRMFQIDPQARSRLNSAFVTNNFIFGAIGSGVAFFLWPRGGWTAIMIAAVILSGFAFTVWAAGRRGALHLTGDSGAVADAV
jgi:hypothetical protein